MINSLLKVTDEREDGLKIYVPTYLLNKFSNFWFLEKFARRFIKDETREEENTLGGLVLILSLANNFWSKTSASVRRSFFRIKLSRGWIQTEAGWTQKVLSTRYLTAKKFRARTPPYKNEAGTSVARPLRHSCCSGSHDGWTRKEFAAALFCGKQSVCF